MSHKTFNSGFRIYHRSIGKKIQTSHQWDLESNIGAEYFMLLFLNSKNFLSVTLLVRIITVQSLRTITKSAVTCYALRQTLSPFFPTRVGSHSSHIP